MNEYLILRILDTIAWPVAFILAAALIERGISALSSCIERSAHGISHDATFNTQRYVHVLTSFLQQTLPATVRAMAKPGVVVESKEQRVARASEAAVIAILQANGGFPGKSGDKVTRAIVREIREMYSELDNPTTAPLPAETYTAPADDLNLDDADADEMVWGYQRDDNDAHEEDV